MWSKLIGLDISSNIANAVIADTAEPTSDLFIHHNVRLKPKLLTLVIKPVKTTAPLDSSFRFRTI